MNTKKKTLITKSADNWVCDDNWSATLLAYALKYAQMMCNIQKQITDISKGLIIQLTNM